MRTILYIRTGRGEMWGVAAKRTRKVRNMVESIKINNFKSLADTELTDCRRYNLLLDLPMKLQYI
ncbi:hypothetical protein H6A66_16465 [Bacteroides caecigallinarum]|uniref:hypothetical protein n=1 Tax=Bacteroides caecigallinarum TaxID=1411144 RepID=UPI00195AF906|nr:hypothetical protein [Bacteroides caecigallinarum]MBM6866734.1 hypothetical protein [Bacteroides caecigallinarum]